MDRVQTWWEAHAPEPAAATRSDETATRLRWLALFAAGACTSFTLELVGAFPVGEFFLVGALGVALLGLALTHAVPAGSLLRSRLLWVFVGCQAVALLGYVISDVSWGSTATDMARGWARMIFLTVDMVAVAYLFDAPGWRPEGGFIIYQIGYAVGGVLLTLQGGVLFDDYWKFGWGLPVTTVVLILAPMAGFWLGQAACLTLGVVHVALGFRSVGALCLVVPVVLLFQRWSARQRLLALAAAGLLAAVLLGTGRLPLRSGQDGDVRSTRSDIERVAMVQAAWEGFLRSPWIGNGSWFSKSNVMQEFFLLRYEKSMYEGIGSFGQDDGDAGFAIHSQILVALAEGGILGGCFFLFYGAMLLWALGHLVLTRAWEWTTPLCVFYLLLKFCDLFTSPFSGFYRVLIAAAVGLILVLWRDRRQHRAA